MKTITLKNKVLMMGLILIVAACSLMPSENALVVNESDTAGAGISATETSTPPSDIAIQHVTIPADLPTGAFNTAGDFDSSKALGGGDRFTFGLFERPFNENTMDVYFSQLDIVNTLVYQDETWIYGILALQELTASSSQNEKYAVELDTDLNGKGDWLIISDKPASTDWTVKGIKAYQDVNQDVGAGFASRTDDNQPAGDGFETLQFDQGQGDDPDTAWVRISSNDPNTIEFAIKKSSLGSPDRFLFNMWAGTSLLDPLLFDINDHFTHEQAGAADPGFEFYYPIKEVAEIDSSCRIAVGFQPTGKEPGLCKSLIPVRPDAPEDSSAGCPPCPPGEYQLPGSCTCYTP
jgi:hypothetical protein